MEIPSATVSVTETAVLDRAVEVGSQAQAVTVQSEVEAIQTTSSALGTIANSQNPDGNSPEHAELHEPFGYVCGCLLGNVSNATQDRKGRDEHDGSMAGTTTRTLTF